MRSESTVRCSPSHLGFRSQQAYSLAWLRHGVPSRLDPNSSLKAGGRSGQADGGLYLKRHRLRGLLIVSELAISLVLLIGAGLLIRSFIRLQSVPPGFTADHVLTMQIVVNDPRYHDEKVLAAFYHESKAASPICRA